MIPFEIPRQILARLALICCGAAAGRVFVVRPAQAALDSSRMNLAAQQTEAAELSPAAIGAAADNAARVLDICRRLEQRLTSAAGANWIPNQFEGVAAKHGVQIFRTVPKAGVTLEQPEERDAPPVIADRFALELAGRYGSVASFIAELDDTLGLTEIEQVRMSPTSPTEVIASIEIVVYHLERGGSLLGEKESAHAD